MSTIIPSRSKTTAFTGGVSGVDIVGAVDDVVHRFAGLEIPSGRTVVIACDGDAVNTPLWAQGIDFRFRPGVFRQVYQGLRAHHAAARAVPVTT